MLQPSRTRVFDQPDEISGRTKGNCLGWAVRPDPTPKVKLPVVRQVMESYTKQVRPSAYRTKKQDLDYFPRTAKRPSLHSLETGAL
jgi:hypothetical protein